MPEEQPPEPPLTPRAGVQVLQYSNATSSGDDWVQIFRARDYLEANLLAGKLQESGLHARVDMENVAAMGSWAGGGPGGSNVQVWASDAVQARQLIDELEQIRAARYATQRVPCPKCHHVPAVREWRPIRVAALAIILLAVVLGLANHITGFAEKIPFLPPGIFAAGIVLLILPALPRWRCTACGHQWAQPEPQEAEEEEVEDDEDEDERRLPRG